jgi:hypothetical protein
MKYIRCIRSDLGRRVGGSEAIYRVWTEEEASGSQLALVPISKDNPGGKLRVDNGRSMEERADRHYTARVLSL